MVKGDAWASFNKGKKVNGHGEPEKNRENKRVTLRVRARRLPKGIPCPHLPEAVMIDKPSLSSYQDNPHTLLSRQVGMKARRRKRKRNYFWGGLRYNAGEIPSIGPAFVAKSKQAIGRGRLRNLLSLLA